MKEKFNLLSDQSISRMEDDKFDREDFVQTITSIIYSQITRVNPERESDIRNAEENLIIGIYGSWGAGKSSLLNLINGTLKGKSVETAFFNPWMFSNEEDLILSLFKLITDKAHLSDPIKDEFAKILKKYQPLVSAFSGKSGRSMANLSDFLKAKEIANPTSIKRELDNFLAGKANPLVIFIDDVDRLSKSEVQILFKTLRLIASFEHVIYVIAFDVDMVAKSIKENYEGGELSDGYAFIEKIIQIPIRIPFAGPQRIFELAKEYIAITLGFQIGNDEILELIISRTLLTPRDVKRFINGFRFCFYHLQESVDPRDLIILELIRLKIQDLFKIIEFFHLSHSERSQESVFTSLLNKHFRECRPDFLNSEGKMIDGNSDFTFYTRVFKDLFGLSKLHAPQYPLKIGSTAKTLNFIAFKEHPDIRKSNKIKNPDILKKYMVLEKQQ